MIVRVTTLGAADGNAAGAVNAVVKYLDGRATAPGGIHPSSLPELPTLDGTTGIVGYYADSVEGPGCWLGRGITGMRLGGEVHPEEFRRVLLGQHAVTGEQLVGARGSAVRADAAGREGAAVAAHGEPGAPCRDLAVHEFGSDGTDTLYRLCDPDGPAPEVTGEVAAVRVLWADGHAERLGPEQEAYLHPVVARLQPQARP